MTWMNNNMFGVAPTSFAFCISCLIGATVVQVEAAQGLNRPLTDKTLVAWVYPASTTQRGGSVLTLMEGEDFDAVVLGERVPGRWMAGSDFFRRTQGEKNQAICTQEIAGPDTMVQVAITYAGNQVSLFRDGTLYSSYRIDKPRDFGRDSFVLIGLRYLGSAGAVGFFHGAIEETRIYDLALDTRTIASLRPNRPSTPRPVAQWTFEQNTTDDDMHTFPPGVLCGQARIAEGKLWLDGTDAYMVSEPPSSESQNMFYVPKRRDTGRMWDTWLYYHEGTYHLFYLANAGGQWDNISMATSPDGVHWKERGIILKKAEGVTWMGTGSTWRAPDDSKEQRFQLNFSEWRGERQTIFFAESADLLHWTRLGGELEFKQDERWYKPKGRWDCIYTLPRSGGGLYGYWTADPLNRPGVGFGQSRDGVRWEALEPPLFVDGAPHGEAGAVAKIGSTHYLMLGSGGMVTLVADAPQGPFRPAAKNRVLLHAGPTYFSRFFPTHPDGLLINHHSIAKNGKVYFGLLKRAVVDREKTLRLGWWPGNEKLKHSAIAVRPTLSDGVSSRMTMLEPILPVDEGVVLEGTVSLPTRETAAPAGLYVECGKETGTAILIRQAGVTHFGPMKADGTGFKGDLRVDRQMAFATEARFRLLLKHWLLEFYLDDVLMECYSLPARATGRIGLVGGPGGLRDLKAWR